MPHRAGELRDNAKCLWQVLYYASGGFHSLRADVQYCAYAMHCSLTDHLFLGPALTDTR